MNFSSRLIPAIDRGPELQRIVTVVTSDEDRWANTTAIEECGLSPAVKSPLTAALNTSAAFGLCGLVPFVSYLVAYSLAWCVVATGLSLVWHRLRIESVRARPNVTQAR